MEVTSGQEDFMQSLQMFVEVEVIGDDASVSEWLAVDNAFFTGIGMMRGVMEEQSFVSWFGVECRLQCALGGKGDCDVKEVDGSEVQDSQCVNLIVWWNELMCKRKLVRAVGPWVHSINMSCQYF